MNLLTDEEIIVIRKSSPTEDGTYGQTLPFARAIEQAIFAKLKEQGYAVVPREPTKEMVEAAADSFWNDDPLEKVISSMFKTGEVSLTSNTE